MIRPLRAVFGAGIFGLLVALPAAAQKSAGGGAFDLLIAGIRAASVSYSGQQTGAAYAVTGHIESAGLVSLIKRLRYDGVATGAVTAGGFAPSSYRESADTGKRQSDTVLEYQDNVPRVVSFTSTSDLQADPADPAQMGDTIDPLSAFYATVRAVDQGAECNLSLELFDGRRASQLQLGKPRSEAGQTTCRGSYIRKQGFSANEMAQNPRFDFTLTLAPTQNGQMQVIKIVTQTIYGKVTLKRR